MRRILGALTILTFAISCGESPPAQQNQGPVPSPEASVPPVAAPPIEAEDSEDTPTETDTTSNEQPALERESPLVLGEQAPDFRLQDQSGSERSLTGLLAKGPVALVFYRSADW